MSKHNEHQNSRMDDFREDLAIDLYPEIDIYNRAFKGKFFETLFLILGLGLIFCLGGILMHHYTTGDWLVFNQIQKNIVTTQNTQKT